MDATLILWGSSGAGITKTAAVLPRFHMMLMMKMAELRPTWRCLYATFQKHVRTSSAHDLGQFAHVCCMWVKEPNIMYFLLCCTGLGLFSCLITDEINVLRVMSPGTNQGPFVNQGSSCWRIDCCPMKTKTSVTELECLTGLTQSRSEGSWRFNSQPPCSSYLVHGPVHGSWSPFAHMLLYFHSLHRKQFMFRHFWRQKQTNLLQSEIAFSKVFPSGTPPFSF